MWIIFMQIMFNAESVLLEGNQDLLKKVSSVKEGFRRITAKKVMIET